MAHIDLTSPEAIAQIEKDDKLNVMISKVDDYLDSTERARTVSQKSRDYKDGYQWTYAEEQTFKKRNQPIVTNNRIKPKVQFLLGMENQGRTDPKGLPRNPNDTDGGEVTTDALRFVHDNNKADQLFTDGFETMVVEGVEAHDISIKRIGQRFEIVHEQIPFDRQFWDPHSRKKDFSDAQYFGILEWMDFEDVLAMPGATEEALTVDDSDKTETFGDRPQYYIDKNRKRVRVFFINILIGGVWNWAVFTKGAFIQEPKPSPFLDENGAPEPQFVFQCAFMDRDNNRYPEVASYLDQQDEINHRASRALHLINQRQTWGDQGAVPDPQHVKRELAKADGHVEIKQGKFGENFGVIPTNDMAKGNFDMMQMALNSLDGQGANVTMTGKDQREISGVAFDKLARGGLVEVGTLFDNHRACKLRVWQKYFNRVKQYWTEERWVRVTDDNNAPKFAGLNRKITMRDKLEEQLGEVPPQFEGDPRLDIVVGLENPVNELDVDVVLEEAPDIGSIMAEQFDILVRLYEANPAAVPFDFLIEASSFRNKRQLIERIQGGTEEQQAALAESQEAERLENEALIKAAAVALIEKDNATANNLNAAAQEKEVSAAKTLVEIEGVTADTEKTDAQTDQIEISNAKEIEEALQSSISIT